VRPHRLSHTPKASVLASNLQKLHSRLIEAVSYDKQSRTLSVRFDDGDLATATLEALKLPDKPIQKIAVDEFRRGVEVHFRDRSTHDISADYFTWLTQPDYAAAYPADASLGPRVGANIVSLRKQRRLSQAALASAAGMAAPNLSRLESGRHVPTLDILLRLSKALGVSLAPGEVVRKITGHTTADMTAHYFAPDMAAKRRLLGKVVSLVQKADVAIAVGIPGTSRVTE
jgi:transcriptional regulator with XRE-family HTH domain